MGRGVLVTQGPFPHTALRTRRAAFTATGSPYESGWFRFRLEGIWDLVSSIQISFDSDLCWVEQDRVSCTDGFPLSCWAAEPAADLPPVPFVERSLPVHNPVPYVVSDVPESVRGRSVPEVEGPAFEDLVYPFQCVFQVCL